MRKTTLILFLLLVVTAAGCRGNSATPASTAVEGFATTPAVTSQAEQLPTATWELATQTPVAPPGCTVVSPRPTPGATESSIFPSVGDDEWQFGPRGAAITLVEYGDFQ